MSAATKTILTDAELTHRVTLDEKIATDDKIRRGKAPAKPPKEHLLSAQDVQRIKALVGEWQEMVELFEDLDDAENVRKEVVQIWSDAIIDVLRAAGEVPAAAPATAEPPPPEEEVIC